ncbi:hypothetical protein KUTeg_022888 [Tegillarca granosa]|uniref:Uncharacterized protein n=1 Tax=Tegillarca granosa TaxID=220873 RepID=A0ABQ9E6B4_TEGGR|nr:hypothetical protein KUTeg_022888 [Tegillarca granosa]
MKFLLLFALFVLEATAESPLRIQSNVKKPENPCPIGLPLKNNAGKELFCGRGVGSEECPKGSSCHIHPTDRYAVCCPSTPKHPCKRGVPEKDKFGNEICCSGCFVPDRCSRGYVCVDRTPGSHLGVCCLSEEKPENPCPIGLPLKNNAGKEIFCGRGFGSEECPKESSCHIHPTDRYAVCCRNKPTRGCKFGKPLGRCDKKRICPRGYSCKRDGGLCCQNQISEY